MPTITSGAPLHYRRHQGALRPARPPVVLVHGAGGNLMHWPADLRRLPGYTTWALDLPGHGGSAGGSCTSIGEYAEAVRGFTDAVALPSFVLIGHSMGGAVALEFALRYEGRLAGLVLVGAGAKLQIAPQIVSGLLCDCSANRSGLGEEIIGLLASLACGERADPNLMRLYTRRLHEVDPQVLRDDYTACSAFDRSPDVGRITLPALVICGEADRMIPVEQSRDLAGRMREVQLLVVPGAGHMVMLEQPAQVAAAVTRFLDDLAAARSPGKLA
jgi:pimeloyl-ACP methyl ester carboxylesterase